MANVKHKFKYKRIGDFYRPFIDITLRNGTHMCKYAALIDSGADFNIFHADIARLLHIDFTKLKEITFGGIKEDKTPCKGYVAGVEIGINERFFNALVVFSADISQNGSGVLDQRGFFEHFRVIFDYTDKVGYLR